MKIGIRISERDRDALQADARTVGLPVQQYAQQLLRSASGLPSLARARWRNRADDAGVTHLMVLRCTQEERAAYRAEAARAGIATSAWVRGVLVASL